MFSKLLSLIKGVIRKLIPYKDIEQVEHIESPLSPEMINAMDDWYLLYLNKAPWLSDESVKSRNLPAFISSELARSITLELDWNITGKDVDGNTQDAEGAELSNPRSEFLKKEFERCIAKLREKLEQGLASGGMTVRPYPKDGHIYFDWTMAWGLYPLSFGDEGQLTDVIFRDTYTEGKTVYTRLERHRVEGENVRITQRAFKSNMRDSIGMTADKTELNANNVLSVFDKLMLNMDNARVPANGRILYCTFEVQTLLKQAAGITRNFDVQSGGNQVNRSVSRIEEVEIVGVPATLMCTKYDFTTGWKVAESGAYQINMFLVHPSAVITPVSYQFSQLDAPTAVTEGKYIYFEESFEDVFILNKKKNGLQFNISSAEVTQAMLEDTQAVADEESAGTEGN